MLRILLTGSNGQVGFELHRSLSTLGVVHPLDRTQLNLTDESSIRSALSTLKPNLIVNAAAYTAVDRAESEADLAMKVNARAPEILASEANKIGAALVHFSTDYVFDGTATTAYGENALTNPINAYGKSKLEGENAICAVGGAFLIFRTSWVYGARGSNFFRTMLRLAKDRPELRVINDQIGAPTSSRAIADATAQIIAKLSKENVPLSDSIFPTRGIYHMTCRGETTWFQFAQEIFRLNTPSPTVVPITTAEYPTPAQRPRYSVLDNQKLHSRFSISLPDWQSSLSRTTEELRQ